MNDEAGVDGGGSTGGSGGGAGGGRSTPQAAAPFVMMKIAPWSVPPPAALFYGGMWSAASPAPAPAPAAARTVSLADDRACVRRLLLRRAGQRHLRAMISSGALTLSAALSAVDLCGVPGGTVRLVGPDDEPGGRVLIACEAVAVVLVGGVSADAAVDADVDACVSRLRAHPGLLPWESLPHFLVRTPGVTLGVSVPTTRTTRVCAGSRFVADDDQRVVGLSCLLRRAGWTTAFGRLAMLIRAAAGVTADYMAELASASAPVADRDGDGFRAAAVDLWTSWENGEAVPGSPAHPLLRLLRERHLPAGFDVSPATCADARRDDPSPATRLDERMTLTWRSAVCGIAAGTEPNAGDEAFRDEMRILRRYNAALAVERAVAAGDVTAVESAYGIDLTARAVYAIVAGIRVRVLAVAGAKVVCETATDERSLAAKASLWHACRCGSGAPSYRRGSGLSLEDFLAGRAVLSYESTVFLGDRLLVAAAGDVFAYGAGGPRLGGDLGVLLGEEAARLLSMPAYNDRLSSGLSVLDVVRRMCDAEGGMPCDPTAATRLDRLTAWETGEALPSGYSAEANGKVAALRDRVLAAARRELIGEATLPQPAEEKPTAPTEPAPAEPERVSVFDLAAVASYGPTFCPPVGPSGRVLSPVPVSEAMSEAMPEAMPDIDAVQRPAVSAVAALLLMERLYYSGLIARTSVSGVAALLLMERLYYAGLIARTSAGGVEATDLCRPGEPVGLVGESDDRTPSAVRPGVDDPSFLSFPFVTRLSRLRKAYAVTTYRFACAWVERARRDAASDDAAYRADVDLAADRLWKASSAWTPETTAEAVALAEALWSLGVTAAHVRRLMSGLRADLVEAASAAVAAADAAAARPKVVTDITGMTDPFRLIDALLLCGAVTRDEAVRAVLLAPGDYGCGDGVSSDWWTKDVACGALVLTGVVGGVAVLRKEGGHGSRLYVRRIEDVVVRRRGRGVRAPTTVAGRTMRGRRVAHGLTTAELARRLGWRPDDVDAFERGHADATFVAEVRRGYGGPGTDWDAACAFDPPEVARLNGLIRDAGAMDVTVAVTNAPPVTAPAVTPVVAAAVTPADEAADEKAFDETFRAHRLLEMLYYTGLGVDDSFGVMVFHGAETADAVAGLPRRYVGGAAANYVGRGGSLGVVGVRRLGPPTRHRVGGRRRFRGARRGPYRPAAAAAA